MTALITAAALTPMLLPSWLDPEARIFRESSVEKTRLFFDRYGNRALILVLIVVVSMIPVAVELLLNRRRASTTEPLAEPSR